MVVLDGGGAQGTLSGWEWAGFAFCLNLVFTIETFIVYTCRQSAHIRSSLSVKNLDGELF